MMCGGGRGRDGRRAEEQTVDNRMIDEGGRGGL